MRSTFRFCYIFSLIFLAALCVSCSRLLGYGVLLWSVPEKDLRSGDVVPVYIRSNINKMYVIGISEDSDEKIEIPLWQLEVFKTRKKAEEYKSAFSEYRYMYAEALRDGLPIRASADNVSERVYRLKEGQRIKIIRKGKGAPVMSGAAPLEGDWYYTLTDDGTFGWCFSYSLRLYDERDEGGVSAVKSEERDAVLEGILSKNWYPENYKTMYDSGRIDLDQISSAYGFFPGRETGVARAETSETRIVWTHNGIEKIDEYEYRFLGTNMTMTLRNSSTLLVQYMDEFGTPRSLFFTAMSVSPSAIINRENERRAEIYRSLREKSDVYTSGSYGELRFLAENRFLWHGYQLLSPSVIPAASGSTGTVEFDMFLHSSLRDAYDGVITFVFDAAKKSVYFLYQIDNNGLRLENVSSSNIRDKVVLRRSASPLILYFSCANGAGSGAP